MCLSLLIYLTLNINMKLIWSFLKISGNEEIERRERSNQGE